MEGASEGLTDVLFAVKGKFARSDVNEWFDGRVSPVSVSNTGEIWDAGVGDFTGSRNVWRAMSANGSRVVFAPSSGQLYVRQNGERGQSALNKEGECEEPALACTIPLSPGQAHYWGANMDDTKIFYTEAGDLFEYDLPPGQDNGEAIRLTHQGQVTGVLGVSDDGSHVYYVAEKAIGGHGVEGQPNLYVSHDAGAPQFIATLSNGDLNNGAEGISLNAGPASARDAVSLGDGALLGLVSTRPLTGYDNEEARPGDCKGTRCREVYLFASETGSLVCASCNPSGACPVGDAALAHGEAASDFRPRDLLDDGALFFESADGAAPARERRAQQRL